MQITRRNFLHHVGGALALTAIGGGITTLFAQKGRRSDVFPLPVEVYTDPLYSMTGKQFERFIGQTFTVTTSDGLAVGLVLKEVAPIELLSNTTRGYYGETFSLVFESVGKQVLEQDTYEIRADGLEQFSALVVPIERFQKRYQIIINRLTR